MAGFCEGRNGAQEKTNQLVERLVSARVPRGRFGTLEFLNKKKYFESYERFVQL